MGHCFNSGFIFKDSLFFWFISFLMTCVLHKLCNLLHSTPLVRLAFVLSSSSTQWLMQSMTSVLHTRKMCFKQRNVSSILYRGTPKKNPKTLIRGYILWSLNWRYQALPTCSASPQSFLEKTCKCQKRVLNKETKVLIERKKWSKAYTSSQKEKEAGAA